MNGATHTVTVHYSETIVRDAATKFFLRYHKFRSFLIVAALVIVIGILTSWMGRDLSGVPFVAIGVLCVLLATLIRWSYVRLGVRRFRSMGEPIAEWSFAEFGFSTRTGLGYAEMSWKTVDKVWRYPDIWLIFFKGGPAYSTLPVGAVASDVRDFIASRVQAHGGRLE
jgi:hypothetical protein